MDKKEIDYFLKDVCMEKRRIQAIKLLKSKFKLSEVEASKAYDDWREGWCKSKSKYIK